MSKNWKIVKQDVDLLIETAYKAKYDSINCPPKEEVWTNIKNSLAKDQRRSVHKKSMTAAVLLLIITGFYFASNYISAGAFASQIIRSIISFTEDTFTIHKKVYTKDGMELESRDSLNFDNPRLAETQSIIHFNLNVPRYIPEDYHLKSIKVLNNIKEHEVVSLYYTIDSTDEMNTEDNFIRIEQEFNSNGANISLNILKKSDTVIKEITVNENDCLLFLYKNGFSKLLWDKGNKSYMIFGSISEDEIIKIAESMK